jgi:hypothetical protein
MAPWSAYQKWGDPPGNRLTKWTLAGDIEIDSMSTGEAVRKAYAAAGVDGTLENKWFNFKQMIGYESVEAVVNTIAHGGSLELVVRLLREMNFYYLLPSFSLLLLGPLSMLAFWRRRDRAGPEFAFALRTFAVLVIGALFWGLVVFGNAVDGTVLHIFSYAIPILAMAGAVAGLRSVAPRFATVWVSIFCVLSLALYVPALDPTAGTSYSPLATVFCALSIAGFTVIALGLVGRPPLPSLRPAGRGSGEAAQTN